MSRLQKENDLKASFGGIKHSDFPPKDPAASYGHQSSINLNQNDVANGYQFCGSNLVAQGAEPKNNEGDLKIVSEIKRTLTADVSDPQKTRNSQSFSHSFASLETEASYPAFDSTNPPEFSWSENPETQIKKEHKPHLQLEDGYSQLPPHGQQHQIPINQLQSDPAVTSVLSLTGRDMSGSIEIKPLFDEFKSKTVSHVSPTESAIDTFPVQTKSQLINHQSFEPISTVISSMKPQGFNLSITDLESCQRNLTSASDPNFAPINEDLTVWLQGDYYSMNFGQSIDFIDYDDPGFLAEVPFYLYDPLTSDFQCPIDSTTECPIVDQGLFIA